MFVAEQVLLLLVISLTAQRHKEIRGIFNGGVPPVVLQADCTKTWG